jgi:DNA-directed RNA polymerase subunit E'/Rpb7
MIELKTIKFKISVNACDLETPFTDILRRYIEESRKDYCSDTIGHIIRVVEFKNITNMLDPGSAECLLYADVVLETYQPHIDEQLTVKIMLVFEYGILTTYNNIKIFIPSSNIPKYVFENEMFILKKKNQSFPATLEQNDEIVICITKFRYNHIDQEYNCIANLVI